MTRKVLISAIMKRLVHDADLKTTDPEYLGAMRELSDLKDDHLDLIHGGLLNGTIYARFRQVAEETTPDSLDESVAEPAY